MQGADKQRLRSELLALRSALGEDEVEAARAAVRAALLTAARERSWRTVAGYVPLRTELGSVELLDALAALGVRVLVPLLCQDLDLDWQQWDPAEPVVPLEATGSAGTRALGRDAIAAVDAVIVPALAVGRAGGVRLGRGGGSYDRALARTRPGTELIALVHDGEVFATLPADDWDVPVTAVLTPSGWVDVTAVG